ncbi:helix-turn-helix domain-containing protein [Streptomyces sp. NPDC001975]
MAAMFSGSRLRQARSEARGGGLSAAALAARVGVSKAQILAYENGQRIPDPPRIRELATALGVRPLDLADRAGMASWQLAELRRASGLRASDLCQALQLTSYSYRRLETTGLSAEGIYGLSGRLASELGVSVQVLERHIAKVPGVLERVQQAQIPLTALVDSCLEPGSTGLPKEDDAAIKAAAAHYARSPRIITRILQQEIRTLREAHRKHAIAAATAHYGATAREQHRARQRMEGEQLHIRRTIEALPYRLDRFFRSQLSPQGWETLGQLHLLEGRTPPTGTCNLEAHCKELGPFVISERLPPGAGTAVACDITRDGQRHYTSFKPWYDALYPWVKESLGQFSKQLKTLADPPQAWLRQCLAQSDVVLFSFDGVLCRLFAHNPQSVSVHLAQAAHSLQLHTGLDGHETADPVAVLRSVVGGGSPEQIRELDGILTFYETEAARHAEPLPGAAQLLAVLSQGPWRMAVVTDHASSAVQAFLTHLHTDTARKPSLDVFGRNDPRLMKPHPHAVSRATQYLGSDRSRTVLIGESLADALAARAAGVQFIGIAAQRRQARMLMEAGAVNVVETLTALIAAASRINRVRS